MLKFRGYLWGRLKFERRLAVVSNCGWAGYPDAVVPLAAFLAPGYLAVRFPSSQRLDARGAAAGVARSAGAHGRRVCGCRADAAKPRLPFPRPHSACRKPFVLQRAVRLFGGEGHTRCRAPLALDSLVCAEAGTCRQAASPGCPGNRQGPLAPLFFPHRDFPGAYAALSDRCLWRSEEHTSELQSLAYL